MDIKYSINVCIIREQEMKIIIKESLDVLSRYVEGPNLGHFLRKLEIPDAENTTF